MNKINQTLRKARDFHKSYSVQNYGVRRWATMGKSLLSSSLLSHHV